jgi:hypothetical protein
MKALIESLKKRVVDQIPTEYLFSRNFPAHARNGV